MGKGFVKLHRKLLGSDLWDDAIALRVFIFCLLSAAWKRTEVYGIVLKPGQLLTTRQEIAQKTGLPEGTVRHALERLERGRRIGRKKADKKANGKTLITIEKWREYQAGAEEEANEKAALKATKRPTYIYMKNKRIKEAGDAAASCEEARPAGEVGYDACPEEIRALLEKRFGKSRIS